MKGACLRLLPSRVCYCLPMELGLQILLGLVMLLRLGGMICGCFYGPYIYICLPLGGLYLAADLMLLYSLFHKSEEGKFIIDFPSQKVWMVLWQVANVLAILGLTVATVWYAWLGTWAMLHDPVHFAVFVIILFIIPFLFYISIILLGFYHYLREAFIDSVLNRGREEDGEDEGLTSSDRRISI